MLSRNGAEIGARMLTLMLTRELFDAFQGSEPDRWDAITADDVVVNGWTGFGIKGRPALKSWTKGLSRSLGFRMRLMDEHLALDCNGDGRGFIAFNLQWERQGERAQPRSEARGSMPFGAFLLTVKGRRIVRIDVADDTLELTLRHVCGSEW